MFKVSQLVQANCVTSFTLSLSLVHTVHLCGHVDDGVDLLAEAEAGGLPLRAVLAGEAVAVEPGPESPLLRREFSDYSEIVSNNVHSSVSSLLCSVFQPNDKIKECKPCFENSCILLPLRPRQSLLIFNF